MDFAVGVYVACANRHVGGSNCDVAFLLVVVACAEKVKTPTTD